MTLEQEREKIRQLHQRRQDPLKFLQSLEAELGNVALNDEETLYGSNVTSRAPTLELMFNPPSKDAYLANRASDQVGIDFDALPLLPQYSETSDSDLTSTDDEDENLSQEELANAAKHVQRLLKRIEKLQHSFDATQNNKTHRKKRMSRIYRRFCH